MIQEQTPDGPKIHKFYGKITILNQEAAMLLRDQENKGIAHEEWQAKGADSPRAFKPPVAVPKDITFRELQEI